MLKSLVSGSLAFATNRIFCALAPLAFRARTVVALAVAAIALASCGKGSTAPVTPVGLATITVTPSSASVAAGATQQFTAVGRDGAGNTVAFSPTWSVLAGGGTITQGGVFTAGGTAGTFANTVRASSGSIAGTASVIVTATGGALATITVGPAPITMAAGASQQFAAVGKDAAGNVVTLAPSWAVVNGGGFISATGRFTTGGLTGVFPATIRATSGTIQGFATVNVTGAITAVSVTPGQASIAAGSARQFTAVATDALGTPVAGTAEWTLVGGGGTLSPSGLFTAGTAAGTFTNTVRASMGGVTGAASVTVVTTAGAVASIAVSPGPTTISAGGARKFIATGFDASGTSVTISPTWSVVGGGGTVNAVGFYSAGTVAGTYANSVTATVGSISGAATVTIAESSPPGQLALITITPPSPTVAINGTAQFTATGFDAWDNVVAITTPVWSVTNGGGTISSTGSFTAGAAPGTYVGTVRATSGGFFGVMTVTVTPAAAARVP